MDLVLLSKYLGISVEILRRYEITKLSDRDYKFRLRDSYVVYDIVYAGVIEASGDEQDIKTLRCMIGDIDKSNVISGTIIRVNKTTICGDTHKEVSIPCAIEVDGRYAMLILYLNNCIIDNKVIDRNLIELDEDAITITISRESGESVIIEPDCDIKKVYDLLGGECH